MPNSMRLKYRHLPIALNAFLILEDTACLFVKYMQPAVSATMMPSWHGEKRGSSSTASGGTFKLMVRVIQSTNRLLERTGATDFSFGVLEHN